jgi:predicted  nucleic acid-binding Zn-ribbon protein
MIDIEHRLTTVEDRSKSNTHRLDEVEKRQGDLERLATSVEVLATREAAVEANVEEIKADVKEMASKPAKRWESIVDKVVWAVLGAMIAFLLKQVGL